jgi:MHS family proline/betaine transporter-like MFS transporter
VLITVWLAAGYIGGYLLGGYLPTYLIRVVHLPPTEAYAAGLLANLLGPPAVLVGGYLIDRFPLRRVALGAMAGVAITALPGFWIITRFPSLGAAVIGQGLWAIFIGTVLAIGAVLSLTLFPSATRFTSTAVTINLAVTLSAAPRPTSPPHW